MQLLYNQGRGQAIPPPGAAVLLGQLTVQSCHQLHPKILGSGEPMIYCIPLPEQLRKTYRDVSNKEPL